MKVAIIGTRGIPNNYGGFEKLTEYLALGLHELGHEVFVYSPHYHEHKESTWKGIQIVHKFDPEKSLGTSGQFIYDLNCMWHARRQHYDVVLNLGYTSSSVWLDLLYRRTRVITNMDGLEWKRSKYSPSVRKFLKYAERLAVKKSHDLIADSVIIQQYLREEYNVGSHFIAYGADLFSSPNAHVLEPFGLQEHSYNLLIARMEPENNIEMVLDGIVMSKSEKKFLVVGNTKNKFGIYLKEKFRGESRIVFTGPIYELEVINNLRFFANLYFHGHSVGGTNPSLLEVMGCNCPIAAHNNPFNACVLGEDASYFSSAPEACAIVDSFLRTSENSRKAIERNFEKVKKDYSWTGIIEKYETLILAK
jgi:glycosyltransferase involved in cell wall biosynthesis